MFNVYIMSLFFISQFIHQLLLCWHLWHQKLLFNATQKYIVESIIVWWLFPKSWLLCMCLRFLQNNRITQTEKSFITRHPTVIHLIQKYIIFQTYHPIESIPIEQWHMTNSYVCTNPLILMKWWWRRIMVVYPTDGCLCIKIIFYVWVYHTYGR